jgi:chromosome segregation ATPase
MPKTVEEILKEEGVIRPLPEGGEKEKIKFEEEIDLRKVVMSIEKLQTEIDTFKDMREQYDERIRELTEKIGEIRSLFFQRESLIKETETKVKMIDDIVSDINPSKYMKELEKRKEEILESQARIEKLELIEKDLSNSLNNLKQTMQNIKSVENLEMLLNEIKDNVTKSRELKSDIERISGKSERFYFEMENRIKEFINLKERTDKVEDLTNELTRTIDSINIRLAAFISKTDIEDFKKSVNSIISSNKEFIENKMKELESFLSLPSEEINNRIEQLKKRRVEVSNLLLNVEEQYKKAFISERTYIEVKQKNESILKQIEEELNQLQAGERFSLKTLPSVISKLEDKTNILERKIEEQNRHLDESLKTMGPESKLANITEVVKIQTDMLDDVIKKMKEINDKMTRLSGSLNSFELRIRFFEVLDGLIRVESSKDITFYITELENLILNMKSNNNWDTNRENLTLNLLTDITNNWRKYGYNEIAKIFDDEIEKIKSPESHKYMLKY